MKKLLLIICVILTIVSCKKKQDGTPTPSPTSYTGHNYYLTSALTFPLHDSIQLYSNSILYNQFHSGVFYCYYTRVSDSLLMKFDYDSTATVGMYTTGGGRISSDNRNVTLTINYCNYAGHVISTTAVGQYHSY